MIREIYKKKKYWMAYTAVFMVMTVILFAPFWTEGKTLVWQQDGVYQHYNAFVYLGTWVRGIFKTLLTEHRLVIPMWEYSIGYGADVFTTLIYYVFGDPFALVSVFTPVKYADVGYTVAILLRFFMAGVVFSLYVRKLGARKDASLLASLMYVFSAYALYSGIRHPFFSESYGKSAADFAWNRKDFQKRETVGIQSGCICLGNI